MDHAIARDYHFFSLIKFAFPTMAMMLFMSLYTIVDGIFVSRFVGTNALSAVNIAYPFINIIIAVAVMLSTGGSAVIARKMGEGKPEMARQDFTLLVLVGVAAGVVLALAGAVFLTPICRLLGASDLLLADCRTYLLILAVFAPACILQILFQTFFVTAGKPTLGLWLTILAGIANAVLDYVFIVPLGMGIAGAALATAVGYLIPAIFGLCFFLGKKGSLYFTRPVFRPRVLAESCFNGSSEMVTNISSGIITFLFNLLMMRLLGENGVAAITIVLYAQFLLTALYLGFSMGVAPIISYNYGSGNHTLLRRVYRICIFFVIGSSVAMLLAAIVFCPLIVGVFSPQGTQVYEIAVHGFLLFSISYLFCGINIFASALFTALSNGKVSALISFLRSLVFIVVGMVVFSWLWGVDGLWLAVPFAELVTLVVSCCFMYRGGRIYHYAEGSTADGVITREAEAP